MQERKVQGGRSYRREVGKEVTSFRSQSRLAVRYGKEKVEKG
jgi:hypothetical protein